jgi:hypothetical protein
MESLVFQPGLVKDRRILLVYRGFFSFLFFLYNTVGVLEDDTPSRRLIYLTIWTFIVLNIFFIVAFFGMLVSPDRHPPWLDKVVTPLGSTSLVMGTFVALMFWTAVYAPDPKAIKVDDSIVIMHGVQMFAIIVDYSLSRAKVLFVKKQVLPTLAYAGCYCAWSLIWYAMHRSPADRIYPVLDYTNPSVMALLVGAGGFIIVLHFLFTLACRKRDKILEERDSCGASLLA